MKTTCLTLFFIVNLAFGHLFFDFNQPFKLSDFLKNPDLYFHDTKTEILDFTEGFLQGIVNFAIYDDIRACVKDSESFFVDLEEGIKDIETREPLKVREGIQLLGQAAEFIPFAFKTCKASDSDIMTVIRLISVFKSPTSFFYHVGKSLLINRVEVIYEVVNAVNAYKTKDYEQLGYWIGRTMNTIALSSSTGSVDIPSPDVIEFVKGFMEGVGSAEGFDEIKDCLGDGENVISDLETGIQDIESKDPTKVKEGIEIIGKAAQIIPDAAEACKAGGVDIKALVKMVESFQNPVSFFYYIGKSLLINHVEVMSEVENVIAGYHAQNYTDIGYWVGKAMDTVFLGEDNTLTQDFADHLNKVSTWQAAVPEKFKGMTWAEIKERFLGAEIVDFSLYQNLTVYNYEGLQDIPESFNSSEQWPGCVHPIRDQGQCGSCWAFAASEALSDRFCIASDKSINVVLSPQYLISCNNILDHGCKGGNPLFSWWFLMSDGLVTDDCLPYASYNGSNPVKCKDFKQCQDGSEIKNYYAEKGSTVLLPNPASIQANVMQYGPVEAAMMVYQDFMYYKGGVYKHTSGGLLGGHAVKIIGWGNENGENYWIVANSWASSWGEDGFFRIAFGQCGIDSAVVTGRADLHR